MPWGGQVDRVARSSADRVSVNACLFALACVICVSCGRSAPDPPTVTPPVGAETISGSERIGWDQPAADTAELTAIRYAIYVDGLRSELTEASCASTATAAGYACSSRLPPLSAGNHTLELASFTVDGSTFESARSPALRVIVTGATAPSVSSTTPEAPIRFDKRSPSSHSLSASMAWKTLAEELDRPTDLAILPDGRVLIAEMSGRVRALRDGALVDQPALNPQFARTHFVFAVYTDRGRSGARSFTLARFREAGDTLADRILLLDDIPTSADPHASLRFGPDGKLYVAFDDRGDRAFAADPGVFNGKILRLNPDGTTPDDQRRHSPVLAEGLRSPRGLDWDRRAGRLWSADVERVGGVRQSIPPASIAIADDALYIGSATGLSRGRIDPSHADRLLETVDIVRGVAVRAVSVAADGTILFATDDMLAAAPPRER
jgi:Glucose / Sorbosone dehydrogenase